MDAQEILYSHFFGKTVVPLNWLSFINNHFLPQTAALPARPEQLSYIKQAEQCITTSSILKNHISDSRLLTRELNFQNKRGTDLGPWFR